jgi:cytochrome c oxidase subunit 4
MSADQSHGEEHGHPQPAEYIKVAVALTIITGIEVMLYYQEKNPLAVPGILILSTLKFSIVVAWYMHLKFDNRLFSYLLVGGLALAGMVLLALLNLLPIIPHTPEL